MTRWMHGPEFRRTRERDHFDPIVEGAQYRLPPEILLAIWERVCVDATDSAGRRDDEQARSKFHELATRVAARGGRLRPDVGAVTRVGSEIYVDAFAAWSTNELSPRTPGRETLVIAEARRWALTSGVQAVAPADCSCVQEQREQPGAGEVARAMAGLQPSPRSEQAMPLEASVDDRSLLLFAGRRPGIAKIPDFSAETASTNASPPEDDQLHSARPPVRRRTEKHDWMPAHLLSSPRTALWTAVARPGATVFRSQVALIEQDAAKDPAIAEALGRRGGGEPLPDALRGEMEAKLGADLRRVRIHTDAAAGAAARAIRARAFAIGEDIFFAPGTFDPDSLSGRELLAHELTHVVQAQQGRVPQEPPGHIRLSDPGEAMEQEAELMARRVTVPGTGPIEPDGSRPGASTNQEAWHPAWSVPTVAVQLAATLLRSPEPGATAASPLRVPAGGTPVNEIGIVAWDKQPALRLRSSPSTTENNIIGSLLFNTHVQVIQRFLGDWLLVATLDGKMGFCGRQYVWYPPEHKMPEPNARLHKVAGGDKGYAINIARQYYGAVADKWGTDLRFYVNVLGAVNHLHVPDSVEGWKTVGVPG